jgi:hypothetical protein
MQTSIVAGSVLHAVEGQFGNFNFSKRTSGGLFLNPFMSIMFCVELEGLATHHLFMNDENMKRTVTGTDVSNYIEYKRSLLDKIRKDVIFPH